MTFRLVLVLSLAVPSLPAAALAAPKAAPNPKADVSVIVSENGTAKTLHVVISPPTGYHLNMDAPLKLDLSGVTPAKAGPYKKDSFEAEQSAFIVPLAKPHPEPHGKATLTYSICDDGNQLCRRVLDAKEF